MVDLTPIFQAILTLICTIITGLLIPFVKSKLDAEKIGRARIWAGIAVAAAEQLFPQQSKGREKKAYVLKLLQEQGIAFSQQELNAFVECAVNHQNREIGGEA